jgi:lysophospholipase L1-like esterase
MRNLVFWGLVPFLAPQALYVRRTAPRFDAAAGPVTGSVGGGPDARLIAIGDSIIAGVGADRLADALVGQTARALAGRRKQRIHWHAIGVPGFNAGRVLAELVPRLPGWQADFIIVSVGVNDITGLRTLRVWRRNLDSLLDALTSHSPGAVIGLAGIPPMRGFPLLPQPLRAVAGLRAVAFDLAGREVAGRHPGVVHVPVDFEPDPGRFAADGYHPSLDSYRIFGDAMADSMLSGSAVSMSEIGQ